ncbi:MAG: acyl-ACP--UDP-N-acetylglucosamine O-acyltransferase [Calditrichaeota bacterium]|nr:MAG: acyl-ACP--UDP-N-acetylglucosamine O-acyltransferase [Calditrichota bacterium]
MSDIHKTAIISPKAELGENVKIGPYTVVEDGVEIGDNCMIQSSVLLGEGAVLGKDVKVFHGASIGTVPQDLKFGGEKTKAIVGDGTTIREFVTFNRGTTYHNRSECGKNCLLMAYSHVAHDCLIGDNVIMANSVNLAGHVEVHDYAILGGLVPVHQFTKIGAHAMVGGGFRVQQDIIPYALAGGYPLKIAGINSVGLKRRGFSADAIKAIQATYKILFHSQLNTTQAVEKIQSDGNIVPEVKLILDFIASTERGIVK